MKLTENQYKMFLEKQLDNKQNKYKAKKNIVDGIKFDSIKESNRYIQLRQMEKLGVISNLQRQVKYELQPSFNFEGTTIRSINYIADFVYELDGQEVIEDVKGVRTKEYLLKKKMFIYKYKKNIKEI